MAAKSGKSWEEFAVDLQKRLTKGSGGGNAEINDDKDLKKFLKTIGYKDAGTKGSHTIFNLQDKKKFDAYVHRQGYEGAVPRYCQSVSVNTNAKGGTIKGILDRVFGLDSLGQKPKS